MVKRLQPARCRLSLSIELAIKCKYWCRSKSPEDSSLSERE